MHSLLAQFVEEYDLKLSRHHASGDGGNLLNNPLLFVIVGDKSKEVMLNLQTLNTQRWNNDKGVFYLFIGSEQINSSKNEQLFSLALGSQGSEENRLKDERKQVYMQFAENFNYLIDLNQTITKINNEIASRGNIYQNFEQLHISVVTRTDDPYTVLMPDIIVLLKSMLAESFKHIQLDLNCLIFEKESQDLEKAMGVAFLKEMDSFQQPSFTYENATRVTKEQIRMDVKHGPRGLFDLVYMISDKNYDGKFTEKIVEQAANIICNINLLKTRVVNQYITSNTQYYSNEQFKREISSGNISDNYMVSAGFSKISTPHRAISTVVLEELMKYIERKSFYSAKTDVERVKSILQVSPEKLTQLVNEFQPSHVTLEDLKAVMYKSHISSNQLNHMTLEEAEHELFDNQLLQMYETNIAKKIDEAIEQKDWYKHVKRIIEQNVINVPEYGLFCAYEWISESSEYSIIDDLINAKKEIDRQISSENQRLIQLASNQAYVKTNFFNMFKKDKVYKDYVNQIVDTVYAKKYEIEMLKAKFKILSKYMSQYLVLQDEYKQVIQHFQNIRKDIRDLNTQFNKPSTNYIDLNISEFYGKIVQDALNDMEAKYSQYFIFEQEGIGNITLQLNKVEDFIQNLINFSKRNILRHSKFHMPFEQELLERTGINVKYDEKHRIMSKDDIYEDLYKEVEMQSTVQIHLYNYKQKISYYEAYLFADVNSEFITYYLSKDSTRKEKLGCIHEKQSSAVEKLTLMGGFKIQDTMYYINAEKIYEKYKENGFEFHAL